MNNIPVENAEVSIVNPMVDIYNSLRKILIDNEIVAAETLKEQQRIAKTVDSMIKVQNEIINQTKSLQIESLLY
jgi:hypothetical protein